MVKFIVNYKPETTMSYDNRKKIYEKIEDHRKTPLIAYVNSIRPNMSASMAGDSIAEVINHINLIPKEQKAIDFLIVSNGGDPIVSLRIITLLRERFDKITVLLPYVAYSAATLLALGANEIVMHPFSNLGPIDPQITSIRKNTQGQQEKQTFSSEELHNYIHFVKEDVGLSDQQHLITAVTPLLNHVGPLAIGHAKRGERLTVSLGEKLLSCHIEDKNKAKSIAKTLLSSYHHHGYAVGRSEAKESGLQIIYPDHKLEQLLWDVWEDFSNEMKCNEAFDPISTIMNDPVASQKITSYPVVNLPANTPPQAAQQMLAQIAQQATIITQGTLKLKNLIASIESTKIAKAVYTNIDIAYFRDVNMSIGFNCTAFTSGWTDYII